jgi:hypothetical protein
MTGIATIFERGQVWFWEDPIYGPKESKYGIHMGESTQRYSRYVIIAQTTGSIDDKTVMAIPLTTVAGSEPSHVRVLIRNIRKDPTYSYAYIGRMFPADVRQLSNYQCKLSREDIDRINRGIAKLLLDEDSAEDIIPIATYEPVVVESCEYSNEDSSSQLVSKELKRIETSNKRLKWTTEMKMKFIQHYESNADECIKEFNIAPRSGVKYYFKFRKDLRELSPIETELSSSTNNEIVTQNKHIAEPVVETIEINPIKEEMTYQYLPSTYNVPYAISKLSNMIRDELKVFDAYGKLESYHRNNGFVDKESFYEKIGNSLYFALVKFLKLPLVDNRVKTRRINYSEEHLATFTFLDKIYNDYMVSRMKNLGNVVKILSEKYENTFIESGLVRDVRYYMERKMDLTDEGNDIICNYINTFCR